MNKRSCALFPERPRATDSLARRMTRQDLRKRGIFNRTNKLVACFIWRSPSLTPRRAGCCRQKMSPAITGPEGAQLRAPVANPGVGTDP